MLRRIIGLVLVVVSFTLATPLPAAGPVARERVAVAVSADRGEDASWLTRLGAWLRQLAPLDKGRATVSGNG